MIYFDIDGVVRHLSAYFTPGGITGWDEPINGKSLIDQVNENLDALSNAPETPYCKIVKECGDSPEFLTAQFPNWVGPTAAWVSRRFKNATLNVVLNPVDKLKYLKSGDYLVEDYPFFHDYSQIILIDWPYNQNVKNPFARVGSPQELRKVLNKIMGNEG